jgi:hypothetical protein
MNDKTLLGPWVRRFRLEHLVAERNLLILDDLAYVTKDQAETSVLFELISARYERRSILITANQPFGEWGKVFSRSRYDIGRYRSPRSPFHHLRDECGKLSTASSIGKKARTRSTNRTLNSQNRRRLTPTDRLA